MQKTPSRPTVFLTDFAIELYRNTLSILMLPSCRHYPSCSVYAKEALRTYGIFRGSLLACRRVLRCRPFASWGYDPLP